MPNNIICNVEWDLYRNNIRVLAGLSKHFLEYLELTIFGLSYGEGNGTLLQYSCLENPHGQRSLVGYSPWGRIESDMTEVALHACMHARIIMVWDPFKFEILVKTLRLLES